MLRFWRIVWLTTLSAAVLASLAGLILWKTEGLRLYSVQTSSMLPVLRPGDLVISLKPANLKPGDIASYVSQNGSNRIISHRVIAIYPAQGYLITKGDNLRAADPAVPLSAVTAKTIKIVPEAGRIVDAIHQPAGLIGLVYLPGVAMAAYEISRLSNAVGRRSYGLGS